MAAWGDVPGGVSETVWWQLSDGQRRELLDRMPEVWYERAGRSWTDERWLEMLIGKRRT